MFHFNSDLEPHALPGQSECERRSPKLQQSIKTLNRVLVTFRTSHILACPAAASLGSTAGCLRLLCVLEGLNVSCTYKQKCTYGHNRYSHICRLIPACMTGIYVCRRDESSAKQHSVLLLKLAALFWGFCSLVMFDGNSATPSHAA